MKNIRLDIKAEDLKKKLNIKDGYTPVKGVDYFDGETPEINTSEIATRASKLAQVELEKLIPSLIPISEPFSLSDKDIENISLDVQSQIVPTLNKEIEDLKKGFSTFKPTGGNTEVFQDGNKVGSGQALNFIGATVTHDGHRADITLAGSQTLQQVTDNGSTTTNSIVSTNAPTFTYSGDSLTNITYSNTLEKDITYNGDGTIDELIITMPDSTVITKSFVWSSGVLQNIIIT